jgi:hypothetical protein
MKRLFRRGAMLFAATLTAAAMMPVAGAQAWIDNITPCDNEPSTPTVYILPGNLGTVSIDLSLEQDNYVQYDGPGTPLDTEVGVDVQTISLAEQDTVCVLLPVVGGLEISVNVVTLHVEVCFFSGQPWVRGTCLVNTN